MMLTKEHFKELLSTVLEHVYEGEDNSIYGAIGAGGEMKYDLVVAFFCEDERIIFHSHSPAFPLKGKSEADILFFVNKWNTEYLNQCCYYDEEHGTLVTSGALFTNVEVSDEYVVENFIHFNITAAIRFFTDAEKQFS